MFTPRGGVISPSFHVPLLATGTELLNRISTHAYRRLFRPPVKEQKHEAHSKCLNGSMAKTSDDVKSCKRIVVTAHVIGRLRGRENSTPYVFCLRKQCYHPTGL